MRSCENTWRARPDGGSQFSAFRLIPDGQREPDLRAAPGSAVDSDLAEGRHRELVGELDWLVAEHGLSERLQAQLMLSLYRCGRQAEALDAYRRARQSANAVATAGGRALGELSYASVDTFENIRPIRPLARMGAVAARAEAAPAPTEEFTPQSVTVTAHVNAVFTLK